MRYLGVDSQQCTTRYMTFIFLTAFISPVCAIWYRLTLVKDSNRNPDSSLLSHRQICRSTSLPGWLTWDISNLFDSCRTMYLSKYIFPYINVFDHHRISIIQFVVIVKGTHRMRWLIYIFWKILIKIKAEYCVSLIGWSLSNHVIVPIIHAVAYKQIFCDIDEMHYIYCAQPQCG